MIYPTTRARQYVDLGGTYSADDSALAVRLFGVVADLAFPIVEHYRSDLYHDARWLRDYAATTTTFYFGCDAWGTSIGTDVPTLDCGRRNVWRVDVERATRDANGDRIWSAIAQEACDQRETFSWRAAVAPVRLESAA